MRGSTLIYSGNTEERQEKIKEIVEKEIGRNLEIKNSENLPDVKVVETEEGKNSIGITESREIIKFLSEKPFNLDVKIVVILDAHKMTSQAQNALLKTLEEPPAYALIILSSKTERALLETVVSRCRKLSVKSNGDFKSEKGREVQFTSLEEIKKLNPGDRLEVAYTISREEKTDIISYLEHWTREERKLLGNYPTLENVKNLELMSQIINDIENTNVNKRLALETLFISLY